ncbi:YtxH domain-containing protein [Paenibacillus sp. ClWae2A]|uniref:YtxH domain-containing protein n=1 Tax=Paenibacillus TaxID=44249 RepID=UPI0008824F61|nr:MULTISPECIES: YtxH domain-containing protein [Paenibacillus]UOK65470.1 YtxH domain-containing protein [Paenibacillus sp. OVF10]MCL6659637.1 YtxH domain-containing protein [Paenibacillus amylolyticus]MDT9718998.1 YtxH domain-containing protein [Paenibacillus sp. ClWae2A]TDL68089.1 YtxH domain-containing protein [Paenibacillus amylolyticus]WJM10201.1 YtxH domain-containing protein [Paenibacillus sp. PK1-4R]
MKDSNKSLLWGALIGSVVGSVTALLLAPKSGRELRQDITEGARQVSEKGQELAGIVGEQSSQIVSKVKETADVVIQDIQSWRNCAEGKEIRISAAIVDNDIDKAVDEPGIDIVAKLPADESKDDN